MRRDTGVELGARLLFVIGSIAVFWLARARNDQVLQDLTQGARRATEIAFFGWGWISVLAVFAVAGLVFGFALRLPLGRGYAVVRAAAVAALPLLGIVLAFLAYSALGDADHPWRFLRTDWASELLSIGMQPLYAILFGLGLASGVADRPDGPAPEEPPPPHA